VKLIYRDHNRKTRICAYRNLQNLIGSETGYVKLILVIRMFPPALSKFRAPL
jgi:hypothetical protein